MDMNVNNLELAAKQLGIILMDPNGFKIKRADTGQVLECQTNVMSGTIRMTDEGGVMEIEAIRLYEVISKLVDERVDFEIIPNSPGVGTITIYAEGEAA